MNATSLLRFLPLLAAVLFAACGHDHDHGHAHPHAEEGNGSTGHHDDHDADHGHDHSASVDLGTTELGALSVQATRRSALAAGGELEIDLTVTGAMPKAIRGWVGDENGTGVRKVRFAKEGEHGMHGHPTLPDPIEAGHKLWLEIEGYGTTSFDLK
jgi:hypothetical protein